MKTKVLTQLASVLIISLLLVSCKKKDGDDDPLQGINDVVRTSKFNASITGDYTDSIAISYNALIGGLEAVTSTYRITDDQLAMLTLKPTLSGSSSINLYAKPGSMAVGTYNMGTFSHGTSSYYNNVLGAQGFEVNSGTFEITSVETIPIGFTFAGQKYYSGNFAMGMSNTAGESVFVGGTFKDVLLISVN